jgi:hypothetical protein
MGRAGVPDFILKESEMNPLSANFPITILMCPEDSQKNALRLHPVQARPGNHYRIGPWL